MTPLARTDVARVAKQTPRSADHTAQQPVGEGVVRRALAAARTVAALPPMQDLKTHALVDLCLRTLSAAAKDDLRVLTSGGAATLHTTHDQAALDVAHEFGSAIKRDASTGALSCQLQDGRRLDARAERGADGALHLAVRLNGARVGDQAAADALAAMRDAALRASEPVRDDFAALIACELRGMTHVSDASDRMLLPELRARLAGEQYDTSFAVRTAGGATLRFRPDAAPGVAVRVDADGSKHDVKLNRAELADVAAQWQRTMPKFTALAAKLPAEMQAQHEYMLHLFRDKLAADITALPARALS